MFDDMKQNLTNWNDDDQIRQYLTDLLDKKAFDKGSDLWDGSCDLYVSTKRIFSSLLSSWLLKRVMIRNTLFMKGRTYGAWIISEKRKMYRALTPMLTLQRTCLRYAGSPTLCTVCYSDLCGSFVSRRLECARTGTGKSPERGPDYPTGV